MPKRSNTNTTPAIPYLCTIVKNIQAHHHTSHPPSTIAKNQQRPQTKIELTVVANRKQNESQPALTDLLPHLLAIPSRRPTAHMPLLDRSPQVSCAGLGPPSIAGCPRELGDRRGARTGRLGVWGGRQVVDNVEVFNRATTADRKSAYLYK